MVQLQEVVADLAATKAASSGTSSGGAPEVVRPGIHELLKLPPPTLEGALGFADWVHGVKPAMSDLSDSSGECWEILLTEARDWYHNQYLKATPLSRVRLKYPTSSTERQPKWGRVRHRMEHLIIQCCPESVRSELSAGRTTGVLSILCKLHSVYKPGGVAERAEALRQVQQPRAADSPIDAVLRLRTWKRWLTRLTDLGGAQPDAALSLQALEVIAGNVLKSLPNLAFRVNLVRASLNVDTQPDHTKVTEYFEHLLAELEGVSRVSEATTTASPSPATKSEATKVRQVAHSSAQDSSTTPSAGREGKGSKATTQAAGGDSPKKLCKWFHEGKGCRRGRECKFLHDWAQIPKGDRADRCIACGGQGHRKDACPNAPGQAKRDDGTSGNKPSRGDPSPKSKADPGLRKVLSDAAGVLREALATGSASPSASQAPGATGVTGTDSQAEAQGEGASTGPVMATAAKIQAQLEDLEARVLDGRPRVRAVKSLGDEDEEEATALLDSGATHAVLDSKLTATERLVPCTVSLAGDQRQVWQQTPGGSLVAMMLVKELEAAKLGELEGRLQRVQAQLKVSEGLKFDDALDEFVGTGSYDAAVAFAQVLPFMKQVPLKVINGLATSLEGVNGWEVLKGLPLNRRTRKRLYQSRCWLINQAPGPVDPLLRQMCEQRGVELVNVAEFKASSSEPSVWRALSWACYSGRVSAIVAEAPMRTWNDIQVSTGESVKLRSAGFPWGCPTNTRSMQDGVNADTLSGLQPFWLWTLASIAKGEGIPMCQTQSVASQDPTHPWVSLVVGPFAKWSNSSCLQVPCRAEGQPQHRSIVACTNLGFSQQVQEATAQSAPLQWTDFMRARTLALFGEGCSGRFGVSPQEPHVDAVAVEDSAPSPQRDGSPPTVPEEGQAPSGDLESQPNPSFRGQPLSDKERDRWRRHIEAHHLPFRKDCLQCIMSGALGLQHRRIKCPNMYALSYDLTGPFQEKGVDENGGCYKYALVAGLRVPDIALPQPSSREKTKPKGGDADVGSDKGQPQVAQPPPLDDLDREHIDWSGAEDAPSREEEAPLFSAKVKAAEGLDGDGEEQPEINPPEDPSGRSGDDEDPWRDKHGVASMSDAEFDELVSQSAFTGANKVLRFVVPIKGRHGSYILAGLQEIVTECHRAGYPVKVVHTDRAKELMSKAIMDWLQSQLIQLHLASSGMGVERWPSAMEFACAEHRHRMLCKEGSVPRFGQKVVFKSKHPTGKSKRPFIRWEHGVYLHPTTRTEGGHLLLRAASNAFLVAKNIRTTEELFDPEAAFGTDALEAEVEDHKPSEEVPKAPERRVTGKRYLNHYLRANNHNSHPGEWTAILVMVADQIETLGGFQCGKDGQEVMGHSVSVGQDVVSFNPKCRHSLGMNVRFARMSAQEWEELCQLDEEQFEERFARWQRVLGGTDEDPDLNPFSARIPQGLLVATIFEQRDWERDPILAVRRDDGTTITLARVYQFSDDSYVDDSPFPDRMLMYSIHDYTRDVFEMVILRVEMIEVPPDPPDQPQLAIPGPPPPEIRAVRASQAVEPPQESCQLPIPLPNPTHLKHAVSELRRSAKEAEEVSVNKAEAATTKGLEDVLGALVEPLSVTHTASQEEVRSNLDKWKESIKKELSSLLGPGVLVSHKGQDAKDRLNDPSTTVISLKGVFTAKPPSSPEEGLFRRKCRLVGCGNQATHVDADSLYAAGAPAEVVRTVLTQGCRHQWSAFTTDIKSAFTQTPIPPHAARRYLLRPPRWMVELGLAEPGEYYSLGKVLYGFKEAPAWWSEHRDAKLLTAEFLGCHLEQGQSDPSVWRIMRGQQLSGYLVTYVDDFLIVSDRATAVGLHQWLLEGAGWQTDGLSEAKPGSPIRFLGMQLSGFEDGHFSLDQEAYVDELIRSYNLPETARSKVVCPKELLFNEDKADDADPDEKVVRAAQKIAGECLWLSQRTRPDIAYTTSVLCAKVSKDPHGALAVGHRLLSYLAQTKGYKLHLTPDPEAPPVRVFTDASFSPQGEHSYGGHIVEVYGVPVLWRASKQALIALSSAEAELIQAVEGATYAEALMAMLSDLRIPCSGAELNLDNTASISFIEGSGNQRTRHLKVRGHKIRQLLAFGWTVKHCRGEIQRADLLTKPLPSQRVRFLCGLLRLVPDEPHREDAAAELPAVRQVTAQTSPCLAGLLLFLQTCGCLGGSEEEEGSGVSIEWPWELALVTLMIVLSTLFVWEATGAPCRRRAPPEVAHVRAVNGDPRSRRSKKLQDQVKAAIDSVVNSPTEDDEPPRARGRNKCPVGSSGSTSPGVSSQGPTVVYGGINMHMHGGSHDEPAPAGFPAFQAPLTYPGLRIVFGGMRNDEEVNPLCAVTSASNRVFGVVTQMEALSREASEDQGLDSPGFLVKGWILELAEGRDGTLRWADFIPSCKNCKERLRPILIHGEVATCPECNGRKGAGRCMRFSCPDDSETPFCDAGCATSDGQAYCGSHPYFGGYDFDPDDPDTDERCCKPGGVPLFQVAVAAHRRFEVHLAVLCPASLNLYAGVFLTSYGPDDDSDDDDCDVTSFRITCHTGERSVISCEEISGELGRVTGATMLGADMPDPIGFGQSRLMLVYQRGSPFLLRNTKSYACEWAGRAEIACPDEYDKIRFPDQIVHLGSSSSWAKLSLHTLWVMDFPAGAEHIVVEELARQVAWRKVLDLEDLVAENPCLLANGPRDGQLMIFIANKGLAVKPWLLVELGGEPKGTSVQTTRLTSTVHIPTNVKRSSNILPYSIRLCGKHSGYVFCTDLGRVYHLRDESIILAEHVWVSPVHDPDAMQRIATFNFTNPGNSAHGVPVAGNQRFCLLGLLMRFEYFRKLFEAWSEGASAKVDMLDTDVATFDHFMQYAQCGRIQDDLDLAMLTCLLRFANKYLLPDLAARCLSPILCILEDVYDMKTQSSTTVAELLLLADEAAVACPTLKAKVMHSILSFRGDLLTDASFLATVASRSSAMLAQLLAPVAPNHALSPPEKRRRKAEKVQRDLSALLPTCPSWGAASLTAEGLASS
ncbi:RE1 [Symbiodinium sp. CCMP2592]|nr:RE1 [Symbiodinium sp. CCMP2592]